MITSPKLIYPEQELKNIQAAHERIKPYIEWTPLIGTSTLSGILNSNIFLKLENIQKTGSFKPRGALNKIIKITQEKKFSNCRFVKDLNGIDRVLIAQKWIS